MDAHGLATVLSHLSYQFKYSSDLRFFQITGKNLLEFSSDVINIHKHNVSDVMFVLKIPCRTTVVLLPDEETVVIGLWVDL